MPSAQGALGEGAPISDKAKGWPVFGEKSEDGAVPEARARQTARPGTGGGVLRGRPSAKATGASKGSSE
jgi:hypothetical protein